MTREDIEQLNVVEPYCFESDKEELWYNVGLKNGLEIADENPKSPWISVEEDLPCNHNELIHGTEVSEGTETVEVFARNEHGDIWTDYMVYENNKWRWNDFEPAYWMIAPKLPK